jgi:hypothetical protein
MYKAIKLLFLVFFLSVVSGDALSAVLEVTSGFPTIQEAVNISKPGDTILVESGTYKLYEHIVLDKDSLTLRSIRGAKETILEGRGSGPVITIANGTHSITIEGFTITRVDSTESVVLNGGGIYCAPYSTSRITHNIITGNAATFGGAIYCAPSSSPDIANNVIIENNAINSGGGIFSFKAFPTISNNRIIGNNASSAGGGIFSWRGAPLITNNIIWKNRAKSGGGLSCGRSSCSVINNAVTSNVADHGGGMFFEGGTTRIANSIFWDNGDDLGSVEFKPGSRPSHSDIGDGDFLRINGNMAVDPRFVDLEKGDLHLRPESPCIDAGNPAPVYNDPDGSTNDMGAYGGPKASSWE